MDIMTGRQYPIINGTRNMITTITGYMRWVNGVVLRRGVSFYMLSILISILNNTIYQGTSCAYFY